MSAKNNVYSGFSSRAGRKILAQFVFLCALVFFMRFSPLAEADEWSQIEQETALEQQALRVNEGALQMLKEPPEVASHFHNTRLVITRQSLADGWVTMHQCHSDLDKVASSQIVYHQGRISNIRIVSSQNIKSAWVEGNSVQMKGIAANSEICITADRRALRYENGSYYLRLGPFIRRFLDGYYPMHVRVEVCHPHFLSLISSSPVKALQRVNNKASYADIDVWVVGKLNIEFVFAENPLYQ